MPAWIPFNPVSSAPKWLFDAWEYGFDAAQRQILFWDVLRKRGNNYIEHLRNGQPPVLTFHYEMILDGRTFERPVNFALVRIVDRRSENRGCRAAPNDGREGAAKRPGSPSGPS